MVKNFVTKRIFKHFSLLVLPMLLSGCSALQMIANPPKFKFSDLKIVQAGLLGSDLAFVFEVDNPNPVPASLNGIDYELFIKDKSLVKGVHKERISIAASGKSFLRLPIRIKYKDFLGSLNDLINNRNVPYRLKTALKVGPFSVPVSHKGTLPMPRLPSISINSLKMQQTGLNGARVLLNLAVKNANAFALPLGKLNYALNLNGKSVAQSKFALQSKVAGGAQSNIQIPIDLNLLKLGSVGLAILRGVEPKAKLDGQMNFEDPKWGSAKQFLKLFK